MEVESHGGDAADFTFAFEEIGSPVRGDRGEEGDWKIVRGQSDSAGGEISALNDGLLPEGEDRPQRSFFFAAGTSGGRFVVDLKQAADVQRVSSFSWHRGERAPQVYTLYGSDGQVDGFNAAPADAAPTTGGWTKIADVDTRTRRHSRGRQIGVSVGTADEPVGRYRYLLFDVAATDANSRFSNTFFSEIDVVTAGDETVPAVEPLEKRVKTYSIADGKYEFSIETTRSPDLSEWADGNLAPVVQEWYPKVVDLLVSDGYRAPERFKIIIGDNIGGVAATGGTDVFCNGQWFKRQLDDEALGAVVHELVHVVQQYGRGWRQNPDFRRTPGWVTEGIADYIRWHLYEPKSAEGGVKGIPKSRLRYDGSYRETASFLAWVAETESPEVITQLNAASREGAYSEEFWQYATGTSLKELVAGWQGRAADAGR